jgi:hypothetical protein
MRASDRAIAISVLAGITLLAAACGAGSRGSADVAASTSSGTYQRYVAYSRCMRTHGAPFWPDPSSQGGGGYRYPITAHVLAQEHGPSWNAVLNACAKEAPSQLPFTEAQLAAADSRLMTVTRCMRAHGYPGWPDPIVNADDVGFLPPRGVNIKNPSPQLQAAEEACLLPHAP